MIIDSFYDNVPLGKYLLVFNPDGPRSGERFELPFESTYYPRGSSRRETQIIEIASTNVHLGAMNLTIGRRVSFRSVVVRVRFPDGAAMVTAEIHTVGEPTEEGGVPWTFSQVADRGGMVRFQAPSRRRLRIEILDWHGRDLKGLMHPPMRPG